jgi:hypothetical protein
MLDIILTVFAWRRGWKAWAVLPMCIGIPIAWTIFFFSVALNAPGGLILCFLVALAELGTLGYMVAKPRQSSQSGTASGIKPAGALQYAYHSSPAMAQPATVVSPSTTAKLVLPNNCEILLNEVVTPIGRNDFDRVVPPEALRYISRQHLLIRSDGNRYSIEDLDSANGTKANGIDIRGKGKQELMDGDQIDVANAVALTFRA